MSFNEIDQSTNKRPNYFAGQYLLEDDFQLEQQYHIDRQRRHNRILHISGIAEGLNISNANGLAVDVSAGTAIDNQGRQIVLLENISSKKLVDNDVAEPEIITADKKIKDGDYILSVGYHHELSKTDSQDKEEITSTRLIEIPQFKLSKTEPPNFIKLAKLTIKDNAVTKIDISVREYSGLRLPSADGQISLRYKNDATKIFAELNISLSVTGKLSVTDSATFEKSVTAGNLTVNGAITPSVGNTETNGIMFPRDSYGGSGDKAWIRYYRRGNSGESTTLEIGTQDNIDDHIALMPSGNVGIGTITPSEKLEVSGNIKATGSITGNSLSITDNVGYGHRIEARPDGLHFKTGDPNSDAYTRIFALGAIVTGMILMWRGNKIEIPEGWALCDGNNGTPNLRDKFIVGAGTKYQEQQEGGYEKVTLKTKEIPRHKHDVATKNEGDHIHRIPVHTKETKGEGLGWRTPNAIEAVVINFDRKEKYEENENYNQWAYIDSWANTYHKTIRRFGSKECDTPGAYQGEHNHPVTEKEVGEGEAHDNLPPYFALCYIMKL